MKKWVLRQLFSTYTFLPFFFLKSEANFYIKKVGIPCLFSHKELSVGWIFDAARHKATPVFVKVNKCFNFYLIIVSAKNAGFCKYIVQNNISIFMAIFETVER